MYVSQVEAPKHTRIPSEIQLLTDAVERLEVLRNRLSTALSSYRFDASPSLAAAPREEGPGIDVGSEHAMELQRLRIRIDAVHDGLDHLLGTLEV